MGVPVSLAPLSYPTTSRAGSANTTPLRPAAPPPSRVQAGVAHTNTYTLTPDGQRVAVLQHQARATAPVPLLEADKPPAPLELRRAPSVIDRALVQEVTHARIGAAA